MVAQRFEPQPVPESPAQALAALRDNREAAARVEVERYRLTCEYAAMNLVDDSSGDYAIHDESFDDHELLLAGEGAPLVSEHAVTEYAAALGMTTTSGKNFVGACMEIRYRLPTTHRLLMSGKLPWGRARLITDHTANLSAEGAAFVDSTVAPVAAGVSWRALERLCEEAVLRWEPERVEAAEQAGADARHLDIRLDEVGVNGLVTVEGRVDLQDALDLDAAINRRADELRRQGAVECGEVLRTIALGDLARSRDGAFEPTPPARDLVVHVHLSDLATQATGGLAECDTVVRGPITVEQVRRWAGNPQAKIIVKPVIDLAEQIIGGSYRPTDRLAAQVRLRDRTCVFPGCERPAERCDIDHVVAYDRGGETSTDNLACLCRRHHRAKTFGGFRYRRIGPTAYEWTTPHGYRIIRDQRGTHPAEDP